MKNYPNPEAKREMELKKKETRIHCQFKINLASSHGRYSIKIIKLVKKKKERRKKRK